MESEPPKKIRKGTKSCVDCRQRKVRCTWQTEDAQVCEQCLARNRTCAMQTHTVHTTDMLKATSRARIERLESDVGVLWTTVRSLEEKLGGGSVQVASPQPQSWTATQSLAPTGSGESDSDVSTSSLKNPPRHILQLFDNGILGAQEHRQASPLQHGQYSRKSQTRSALQQLMPTRKDMRNIAEHAATWLFLYNSLFPATGTTKTSAEVMSQYEELQDPDADPTAIAAFLLFAALSVQQGSEHDSENVAKTASSFIREVSETVERYIVSDDAIAGTVEGMKTTMVFLRLQLAHGSVKKLWLGLRRLIALAELMGLPNSLKNTEHRSNQAVSSDQFHEKKSKSPKPLANRQRQRAEIWEAICAFDRMISMMWSMPLGTGNYPLPSRPLLDAKGAVIPQAYLYELCEISRHTLELDSHCSLETRTDLFEAAMSVDQELKLLASRVPSAWWTVASLALSVDIMLQYWHRYLTIRAHLPLALIHDENQQYFLSFATCSDASQELARRYLALRPLLPAGFFIIRLYDLQAFTALVFLSLAAYRVTHNPSLSPQAVNAADVIALVDQVAGMMEHFAEWAGGDLARQAAVAVRSLNSLLQRSQTSKPQDITLSLPYVGKIHVSRKIPKNAPLPNSIDLNQTQQAIALPSSRTNTTESSTLEYSDMLGPLSYSLELPETYPFLGAESFDFNLQNGWYGSV